MTNLFLPRLRAHKLSAAVGSGKTRAAIAWIANPFNATRNVLYVAPTKALVDQTARALRDAIAAAEGDHVRNVNLIHTGTVEGQVQIEALSTINAIDGHEGCAQLLTTQTFLSIVSRITRPELWSVVLDEAFNPATFATFRLGTDALRGWEHFCELFSVDPDQGHRILPREGKRTVVEEVSRSDYSSAGDRFKSLEDVARAVANPAIRCELVMTDGAVALLAGSAPTKRKARKGSDADPGTVLQFSSYVDPVAFAGFRQVLFLSALFEQTILYSLWTKALGVTFEEHPDFPSELLRDTHKEQGRFLAVGHLLHRDDPASLDNLSRETLTGKSGATKPGTRVIDHLVAAHFDQGSGMPTYRLTPPRGLPVLRQFGTLEAAQKGAAREWPGGCPVEALTALELASMAERGLSLPVAARRRVAAVRAREAPRRRSLARRAAAREERREAKEAAVREERKRVAEAKRQAAADAKAAQRKVDRKAAKATEKLAQKVTAVVTEGHEGDLSAPWE